MNEEITVINDEHVTLRHEESEKKYFQCPVCGEIREVELTKRGKPYLTCNECGVQLFVRGKKGIRKFKAQYDNTGIITSYQLLLDIDVMKKLHAKLTEIRNNKPLFGTNDELEFQERIIEQQLTELKKKYKA